MKCVLSVVILAVVVLAVRGGALTADNRNVSPLISEPKNFNVFGINTRNGSARFQGGHIAEWTEFPYVVAILKKGILVSVGVIVADQYILTSQDIASASQPKDLTVTSGDIEKKVIAIYSSMSYIPGYLSVIKLASKFDLNGPNIAVIDLPSDQVPTGTNCTVVGVGGTDEETGPEDVLHFMTLPTVDNAECSNALTPVQVNVGHLCGGHFAGDLDDTCKVSPGSPLVCNGVLSGIASILNYCHNQKLPSLYGNVAYHKTWIEEQITTGAATQGPTTDKSGSSTAASVSTSVVTTTVPVSTSVVTTTVPTTTTPGSAPLNTSSYSVLILLFLVSLSLKH